MSGVILFDGSILRATQLFDAPSTTSITNNVDLVASSQQTVMITNVAGTGGTSIVTLPDATTLTAGQRFTVINEAAQATVTVRTKNVGTTYTLRYGQRGSFICRNTSSADGLWVYQNTSALPPSNINSRDIANYYANRTLTADDVFSGPLFLSGTFTCTLPTGANLYSGLTTILGYPPPVGMNWRSLWFDVSGTQTFASNTGCSYYGPTSSSGTANHSSDMFFQITSPTTYIVINVRDY